MTNRDASNFIDAPRVSGCSEMWRGMEGLAYRDGECLDDETKGVETQFAVGG